MKKSFFPSLAVIAVIIVVLGLVSGGQVSYAAKPSPDTTPPVITNVQATSITSNSAVISWNTNEKANSTVKYGTALDPITLSILSPKTISSALLVTSHSLSLTGLSLDTKYYYGVTSCDAANNCNTQSPFSFKTSPVTGSWKHVSSPNVEPSSSSIISVNRLRGVSALSANDVWTVGWSTKPNGPEFAEQTLIEHWDGAKWSIIPSPNPVITTAEADVSQLYGVAALSPNDVWAVGEYKNICCLPSRTLIEHWDGAKWSIVPSPSPETGSNSLQAVAAVSANDVWAAGYYGSDNPNEPVLTLILHWDGAKWSQVPSPNPNRDIGYTNGIYGITVVSANDIWAVGFSGNYKQGFEPLILHWDGRSWNVQTAPKFSTQEIGSTFYGVSAVSANDIWAVGLSRIPYGLEGAADRALIQRSNGRKWSVVTNPYSYELYSTLYAVSAVSANEVWTVGDKSGAALILYWNGASWKEVPAADVTTSRNVLRAVDARTTGDAWTVGEFVIEGISGLKTLTERYSIP